VTLAIIRHDRCRGVIVRLAMPCCVRKWNLTQTRSSAAFDHREGWLPKKVHVAGNSAEFRDRTDDGDLCSASGSSVQKSQLLSALRSPYADRA